MAIDFPPEENELHWHDFDSVVYVTAGEVTLSLDNGESAVCQRGAKIVASAGVAHREKTSGYSAIMAFSRARGADAAGKQAIASSTLAGRPPDGVFQ